MPEPTSFFRRFLRRVIGGVGKVRDEEPQKKLDSLGAFLKSLGGGNSNISGIFTPILGEMIHFDEYFFNHQPDQVCFGFLEDDLTHNPYCSRVLASYLIDIACSPPGRWIWTPKLHPQRNRMWMCPKLGVLEIEYWNQYHLPY